MQCSTTKYIVHNIGIHVWYNDKNNITCNHIHIKIYDFRGEFSFYILLYIITMCNYRLIKTQFPLQMVYKIQYII